MGVRLRVENLLDPNPDHAHAAESHEDGHDAEDRRNARRVAGTQQEGGEEQTANANGEKGEPDKSLLPLEASTVARWPALLAPDVREVIARSERSVRILGVVHRRRTWPLARPIGERRGLDAGIFG